MIMISRLQAHVAAGDISRRHYNTRLRDFRDAGEISEIEFEEAMDFDPPRGDTVDAQETKKAEALEMLGIKQVIDKKPKRDPEYELRLAAGLELLGLKPAQK